MFMIRLLDLGDAPALLEYFENNREHLKPWIPILPEDFYTVTYQERRLESYKAYEKRSEEFRFGVFDGPTLAAGINLTAVEYGAFMNGRLGYSVGATYVNKGVATKFIHYVTEYASTVLGLHRVEANVMPRNVASKRVLAKCGFEKVGYSPKMVCIAGAWEDHEMYARILST